MKLSFGRFWSQFSKVQQQKRPTVNFDREKSEKNVKPKRRDIQYSANNEYLQGGYPY